MSDPLRELSEQYASALQNYLKTEGEQALHQAYELGRRAITDGLGVLDIAKIHQQASIALLPLAPTHTTKIETKRNHSYFCSPRFTHLDADSDPRDAPHLWLHNNIS